MLWTIVVILVILWILGLVAEVGGGLINLLLLVAAIIVIYNFVAGRSKA